VLSPDADTLRLFLHVLGATLWVGGQLTLAPLVPALREVSPDAPRAAARRFGPVAGIGFLILLLSGIWNTMEVDFDARSTAYGATFGLKMTLFTLSGVGALVHALVQRPAVKGAFAGVSTLTAVGALFLGILLTTGA
jgi:putative copper export protein